MQYVVDFTARLEGTGEFVDAQVTDGPFAETKDLIAGSAWRADNHR